MAEGSVFSPYEIRARIFPGVLAVAPVILLGIGLTEEGANWEAGTLVILISLAVAYVVALAAAERGRRLEKELFKQWGGIPSVQVLRHSDRSFSPERKHHYHSLLSKLVNIKLPSAGEEARDRLATDQIYEVVSNFLRERTRKSEDFPTLVARNTEYGFQRNGMALRPAAVVISLGTVVAAAVLAYLGNTAVRYRAIGVLVLAFIWGLVFLWYFSKERVKTAAFRYARTLIEQSEAVQSRI